MNFRPSVRYEPMLAFDSMPGLRSSGCRLPRTGHSRVPAHDARFAKLRPESRPVITKADLARRVAAAPGLTGAARAAALVRNEQAAEADFQQRYPTYRPLKRS